MNLFSEKMENLIQILTNARNQEQQPKLVEIPDKEGKLILHIIIRESILSPYELKLKILTSVTDII